jgi:hypothetical protein
MDKECERLQTVLDERHARDPKQVKYLPARYLNFYAQSFYDDRERVSLLTTADNIYRQETCTFMRIVEQFAFVIVPVCSSYGILRDILCFTIPLLEDFFENDAKLDFVCILIHKKYHSFALVVFETIATILGSKTTIPTQCCVFWAKVAMS